MDKVRVLWCSDHVTPTGFSRVAHGILKYFPRDKYEVFVLAVNYFGDPHEYDYKIFPASIKGDVYGFNRLEDLINGIQPQIIFILNDAWVIKEYLKKIKSLYPTEESIPRIITYIPVDATNHSRSWYEEFNIVSKVVAYTEFGKKVIEEANPSLVVDVIPHGIDSTVFYKMDRAKTKKVVYPNEDHFLNSFVILSAHRNQPRKRLDISMKAFKLFSEGKDRTVKLYMHCGITDSHIHILEMARRLDIEDRLILSSVNKGVSTLPDQSLNLIYNACDVGLNTGLGEGWSLPNMEHAVTGAPQVIADHSALHELYEDCGLLVPTVADWTQDGIMTTGRIVKQEDVAEALQQLYVYKELYDSLAKKAYRKFTAPEYSWENISKQWDTLFESVL